MLRALALFLLATLVGIAAHSHGEPDPYNIHTCIHDEIDHPEVIEVWNEHSTVHTKRGTEQILTREEYYSQQLRIRVETRYLYAENDPERIRLAPVSRVLSTFF
jgi:hypothetical protein